MKMTIIKTMKLIIILLCVLVGFSLLAGGAGLVFLSQPSGQKYILPKILKIANSKIQGKIDVDKVEMNLSGEFAIKNLILKDSKNMSIATIDEIKGTIELFQILNKKFAFSSLNLNGSVFKIQKNLNGRWNILEAVSSKKENIQKQPSQLEIELKNFKIKNLRLIVDDLKNPFDAHFEYINSNADVFGRNWSFEVESFGLSLNKPILVDLTGALNVKGAPNSVVVSHLKLESSDSVLEANGKFGFETKDIDFNVLNAEITPSFLQKYTRISPQSPIVVSGKISGTLEDVKAKFSISQQDGQANIDAKGSLLPNKSLSFKLDVNNYDISQIHKALPKVIVHDGALHLEKTSNDRIELTNGVFKTNKGNLIAKGSLKNSENGWKPNLKLSFDGISPAFANFDLEVSNNVVSSVLAYEVKPSQYIKVVLKGLLSQKFSKGKITKLLISMPKNSWHLQNPTEFTIKPNLDINLIELSSTSGQKIIANFSNLHGSLNARLFLKKLDLTKLPYSFSPNLPKMSGIVDASLKVTGDSNSPVLKMLAQLKNGSVYTIRNGQRGPKVDNIHLAISGDLNTKNIFFKIDGFVFEHPLHANFAAPRQFLNNTQLPIEADVRFDGFDISELAKFGKSEVLRETGGKLNVHMRMRGSIFEPRGVFEVAIRNAKYKNRKKIGVDVIVDASDLGKINTSLTVREDVTPRIHADFNWVGKKSSFPKSLEDIKHGFVSLNINLIKTPFLEDSQDLNNQIDGNIDGVLSLEGYLNNPKLEYSMTVEDLTKGEIKLGSIKSSGKYENREAEIKFNASISKKNNAQIYLYLQPNLDLNSIQKRKILSPNSQFRLKTNIEMDDLTLLTSLIPNVKNISGSFFTNLSGSGKLSSPQLNGKLFFNNGLVSVEGVRTFKVNRLDASFQKNQFILQNLKIQSGGDIFANGFVENVFSDHQSFLFQVESQSLMIEPSRYPSDTLDSKFKIKGEIANNNSLSVLVNVDSARIWIPQLSKPKPVQSLQDHPDIELVNATGETTKSKDSSHKSEREMTVQINAPKNIWVQGPDFLLEFGSRLKVQLANGDVDTDGYLALVRPGQLNFLGKEIKIESTRVDFRNSNPKDASIKIEANYTSAEAKVFVEVDGTLGNPNVTLKSEPPMPEFQIASLLIGGDNGQSQMTDEDSSLQDKSSIIAANAIGSLVTSKIESAFFPRAPVTIQARVEDPNEHKGNLAVGKYVNPNLFVSYERQFGADLQENTNQVRFDYRLARRWTLEGFFGDAQEGGVDIFWKKLF